jgi:hypothetical protein
LQFVVGIRVLVFFARTFRIGFWWSVWLQIRFVLPLIAVAAGGGFIVAWAGLSPLDDLVAVLVVLIAVLIILAVAPAGRNWMARAVVPPRQPSTVDLMRGVGTDRYGDNWFRGAYLSSNSPRVGPSKRMHICRRWTPPEAGIPVIYCRS